MEAVTTKRRKSRKKTSVADKVFVTLNTLFMIMFVIITLYPVLNTLAISLNDGTDALRGGIYLLPRKFTWKISKKCLPSRSFFGIIDIR